MFYLEKKVKNKSLLQNSRQNILEWLALASLFLGRFIGRFKSPKEADESADRKTR